MTSDQGSPPTRFSAPVPLSPQHATLSFDCGVPALNDWLRDRALANESRFSRTYVVCENARVCAYYCLSVGAVERATAPGKLRRNAPDAIPVSIIGRLAVDREYARQGLGADLLSDALRRIAVASQSIGIAAVLVQAKDDSARRFYLRHAGFVEHPADSRTLFLSIETLIAALTEAPSSLNP